MGRWLNTSINFNWNTIIIRIGWITCIKSVWFAFGKNIDRKITHSLWAKYPLSLSLLQASKPLSTISLKCHIKSNTFHRINVSSNWNAHLILIWSNSLFLYWNLTPKPFWFRCTIISEHSNPFKWFQFNRK